MLTYRVGAAGSPASAIAMATYLASQALLEPRSGLSRYYAEGQSHIAHELGLARSVASGEIERDEAVDLLASRRVPPPRNAVEALADQVRMGEVSYSDALDDVLAVTLRRSRVNSIEAQEREERAAEAAFNRRLAEHDLYVTAAAREIDRTLAALRDGDKPGPEVRADLDPALADLLKLDPRRRPGDVEVANLLNGLTADGERIPGKGYQKADDKGAPIGFIDLTFSADKSVSLAWAFAPTKAEADLILEAHRDAVDAASAFVASFIGRLRKGHAGRDGWEPAQVAWLSYDHTAARPTVEVAAKDSQGRDYTEIVTMKAPGDPQLHTHRVVLNVARTEEGRVGSLNLGHLQGRVKVFGGYYQAQLAANLRRSGIAVVADPETGAAVIPGIPRRVREEFSKRSREASAAARAYAKEHGVDWDALSPEGKVKMAKNGARTTRNAKDQTPEQEERAAWQRQAERLGWKHASVVRAKPAEPLPKWKRIEAAHAAGERFLSRAFEHQAVVTDEQAQVAACAGLVGAGGAVEPRDIYRVTAAFRERGINLTRRTGKDTAETRRTSLVWAPDPHGRHRMAITTALHEDEERELIQLARSAASDRSAALSRHALRKAVNGTSLDFTTPEGRDQHAALTALGTGGRFGLAIGAAGVGKSALLTPLTAAWKAQGRVVIGTALAWRQTEALADAGIENRYALASLLARAEQKSERRGAANNPGPKDAHSLELTRDTVIAIDEIGQVGTRQLLALLRLQQRYGFQIVALGDPKQCQSIEAGPVVELLQRALPNRVPELLKTIRQGTERERQIATLFREGEAEQAITMKRQDRTAQLVAGDRAAVIQAAAELWKERTEANRREKDYRITVFAPTNADARDVSAAIREVRRARGEIGPDVTTLDAVDQRGEHYRMGIAVGDRVRLFDRVEGKLGFLRAGKFGNNGAVVTIREIREDALVLEDRREQKARVKWSALRDADHGDRLRLAHGDCLTIDAGQGLTSTEHIDVMPSGSSAVTGFKSYVSESRHRRASFMLVADGAERREITARRPIGDERAIGEDDVWANVARNLSRQPERESATAMIERLAGIRRGAARAVQRGVQAAEASAAAAGQGSTARARAARVRRAAGVSDALRAGEGGAQNVWKMMGPAMGEAVRAVSAPVIAPAVAEAARKLGRIRRRGGPSLP